MRLTRVYGEAPLSPGIPVTLPASAARHVTRVLRLRVGEPLTLFNGRGGEYAARIEHTHGGTVSVAVGAHSDEERESPLAITLAQGVSRGERMDMVVQKATELGVAALQPVLTERSVVRLSGESAARRVEHWQGIAVAACEQSARNRVPQVRAPLALREYLRPGVQQPCSDGAAAAVRLLLSPGATLRIAQIATPVRAVTVLIGPEGGLTPQEQDAAVAAGFTAVRLGPRVLRTETAAIAALTLLQREFGDL
jgi:16S rRNA (uracil1498-N3)-methyltransferase